MRNIADYLRDKYGSWGWMGQRAHDACGINRILKLDFIISCDYGMDVPYYFRENDVFSIEKRRGIRKDWSNEDLNASLRGALGREILEKWNSSRKTVNLLCYRSVKRLENSSRTMPRKPRIYAVPESLKKHFDNKILLQKSLPKLSLSKVPGKVDKLGKATFNSLRREFSLPFVIQFPYSSSGHFTFIVREEKEYNKLRRGYPDSSVVIRKYVDGFSLNVNGVIVSTEDGPRVACSFPSVQITGVPECSNFPSAFCGNDYTAARDLDRGIIRQVENHVRVVGMWMAEAGFRGVFGMDFVVGSGTVYPVEINPRFQNSSSLYTILRSISRPRKGMLFFLHIAEFLQKDDKVMRRYIREFPFEDLMYPLNGCQIILHNRMRRNVITGEFAPGVYRPEDRNLKLVKKGASLDLCQESSDVLVTCGVPKPYTTVEPNAPVCKIQMRRNALDPVRKRKLSPEARKIVSNVYDRFGFASASRMEMAGERA